MIKNIVGNIVQTMGFIIPNFFGKTVQFIRVQYTSGAFRKGLHKCGTNVYVMYPAICNGKKYISIGKNFKCFSRSRIEAFDEYAGAKFKPEIIIGDNVNINFDFHMGAINRIKIGDNVLIGSRVTVTDHNHGNDEYELAPVERPLVSKGEVCIGDNVWIGENVTILPDVHIGENAIIGAGAVVCKDIPADSIAVGNPARVIRKRG